MDRMHPDCYPVVSNDRSAGGANSIDMGWKGAPFPQSVMHLRDAAAAAAAADDDDPVEQSWHAVVLRRRIRPAQVVAMVRGGGYGRPMEGGPSRVRSRSVTALSHYHPNPSSGDRPTPTRNSNATDVGLRHSRFVRTGWWATWRRAMVAYLGESLADARSPARGCRRPWWHCPRQRRRTV